MAAAAGARRHYRGLTWLGRARRAGGAAEYSVLNSMYRSGLVDTLVTHANMKGLGLTPIFGDRRGFMPPQLKTKKTTTL